MATAGIPAMITTNRMARSFSPNHRMASGSQEIEGSAWRPVIRLPTLRWMNWEAAMAVPITVPTTTATPMPTTSRIRLFCSAAPIPSVLPGGVVAQFSTSALPASPGGGSWVESRNPEALTAHQTASSPPMAATRGQI
jgi:hypothetical protein